MSDQDVIRLGFFASFKGVDTLLLAGDEAGVRLLSSTFAALARSGSSATIHVHLLSFVFPMRGLSLIAFGATGDEGITRDGAELRFTWRMSAEGWEEFAEKTDAVAEAAMASHCYLSGGSGDRVVAMVSKGEYDEKWWEKHWRA